LLFLLFFGRRSPRRQTNCHNYIFPLGLFFVFTYLPGGGGTVPLSGLTRPLNLDFAVFNGFVAVRWSILSTFAGQHPRRPLKALPLFMTSFL
jgi:hypothetical protein